VYDLGCSTGFLLKKIKHKHQDKNIHYFGYDISDNLLSNSEDKLFFIKQDITEDNLLFKNTDLILSIFTLQFLSVTNRTKILKKVYDSLNKGGCFILTEKIYMSDGFIQDIYNFTHYDIKRKEFKSEDILNKQVTLREIMKPLTDNENKCVLKKAGFKYVESFFQSLNFKGWICIK
jgi:tRNA (cmo5U34)-methyltransferase